LGFCAYKAKFFCEPHPPCIEISLLIVKNHTIFDQPDCPTSGDDDFPEDGASLASITMSSGCRFMFQVMGIVFQQHIQRAFKESVKECFFVPCATYIERFINPGPQWTRFPVILGTADGAATTFVTHSKLRAPGLRNKVTNRLKLDVGHVA